MKQYPIIPPPIRKITANAAGLLVTASKKEIIINIKIAAPPIKKIIRSI
jgi:hypothetical protein